MLIINCNAKNATGYLCFRFTILAERISEVNIFFFFFLQFILVNVVVNEVNEISFTATIIIYKYNK